MQQQQEPQHSPRVEVSNNRKIAVDIQTSANNIIKITGSRSDPPKEDGITNGI